MGVVAAAGSSSKSWAAAFCKKGGTDAKVGKGIGSSEGTPRGRPPRPPLPLCGASSSVYKGGVYE
jgi:hypothetical protein